MQCKHCKRENALKRNPRKKKPLTILKCSDKSNWVLGYRWDFKSKTWSLCSYVSWNDPENDSRKKSPQWSAVEVSQFSRLFFFLHSNQTGINYCKNKTTVSNDVFPIISYATVLQGKKNRHGERKLFMRYRKFGECKAYSGNVVCISTEIQVRLFVRWLEFTINCSWNCTTLTISLHHRNATTAYFTLFYESWKEFQRLKWTGKFICNLRRSVLQFQAFPMRK